jgi:hypothetical protein
MAQSAGVLRYTAERCNEEKPGDRRRKEGSGQSKIADQGSVVRKADRWNLEILDRDLRAVQNKIELSFGRPAGMGRLFMLVGADKAGSSQEEIKLPISPEDIEITGNNNRFFAFPDNAVQLFQLVLTVAVRKGKMNQKDGKLFQTHLYHQPFDSLREIMKTVFDDGKAGQDCIALSIQDWQPARHRAIAILGFHHVVMPQPFGYMPCLTPVTGPERATVHLDQTDNIRLYLFKKTDYIIEY